MSLSSPIDIAFGELSESAVSRAELCAALVLVLVLVNENVLPADAADPDDWRAELGLRPRTWCKSFRW
ncbi:hypothetical protein AB0J63_20915 [Streptosporangium canum]|uniref:hypothetical protein n=1 Tax=Streptosporangium canum TaxID=324952 RepID=UPI00342D6F4A